MDVGLGGRIEILPGKQLLNAPFRHGHFIAIIQNERVVFGYKTYPPLTMGPTYMRTTLTIEVRYNTRLSDEQRREAFIAMATEFAKQLYAQAAMLAEQSPNVKLSTVTDEGRKDYPIFK